ncbi:MAG TPA: YhfC family glutamic-type intramembrane protease, partial [Anaerolineales bacterium]|nr:YhfC family glutamic-type intramembrane protease [Anaerolineales bacterium]
ASSLSVLIMLIVPIVLVVYLTRKFSLSWKLALAGALTFIASQVLHIPVVYGLTALFQNGTLSIPDAWTAIFNAIVLGLLAGIFEETARWVLFKFSLKNAKTWGEGVLVGAGHGGVESFLLGLLAILTLVNMVVMRNADLAALGIPAEQIDLTRQQVDAFWSSPFYLGFLGGLERIFAICLHLSLSVMVLYSVVYKRTMWFWIALLWHAFIDAVAVYLLPIVGALALEGIVGVLAAISLWIVFTMRPWFAESESTQSVVEA